MTLAPADVGREPDTASRLRPARRRWPVAGWIPAALAVAFAGAVLVFYGVAPADLARFAAYLLLVIVVPGTLVWRALRGGSDYLVSDVAAGSVVGYALEVLAYLPARAAGNPWLALAAPAGILVAFLAVPRLRGFWRGSGDRVPAWWAWAVSACVASLVVWSAASFFRGHGLTWPGNGAPYIDMTYHLALAGEVRHHVPPVTPYVVGEPLNYHWFVYADVAATNVATGIEVQTLLYRFSVLPMIALLVMLLAVLGRRLTGQWWAGPAAVVLAFLAAVPTPFPWTAAPVTSGNPLGVLWLSPTQTFGALLFAPLVLLLVELCRDRVVSGRLGRWILVALLLAVLTGAKATFLPILLAALLFVLAVDLLVTHRLNLAVLLALALAAAALAFAQLVLFDGSSGGLVVDPFYTARTQVIVARTGLAGSGAPVALLFCAICWAGAWAAAFGVLARMRTLTDPATLLLIGIGVAGVGGALAFRHPGASQIYFFQSARPYLGLLATVGLAAALAMRRPTVPIVALLLSAGVAGGLTARALRATGDTDPASAGMADLLWPYAVLAAAAALVYLAVRLAGRNGSRVGTAALAAALVFVTGSGFAALWNTLGPTLWTAASHGWRAEPRFDAAGVVRTGVPDGAVETGRWLRDHSSPDDVIATNAHCYAGSRPCPNRHFWISGYAERRVLVEGWGYTQTASVLAEQTKVRLGVVPYWDPQLLEINDRVFAEPTPEAVNTLRDRFGVRWLFVDRRFNPPPPALDTVATLRFESGDCAVYEIR